MPSQRRGGRLFDASTGFFLRKLLISPVKNRIFLPKNDQIWPKIGIFVHFGLGLAGSFGGLVGGCGARAVSRKTPI